MQSPPLENQLNSLAVSEDEDPMTFIEESKEYHNWMVTIKDPHSQVEKEFSVVALNLAAHSVVFRRMMTDPKWVKEKRLIIPNMSPQTFDLIYRFVNGAELGLQKLSREDLADLALAADMYMIPRLVKESCKHLVPNTLEQVFPALTVVVFVSNTELEPPVTKYVQQKTKEIMESAKFLQLDVRCLEFIVKQEKLSLSELKIWKCLVKWGRHQVAGDEANTLRSVLGGALKFVRFRTLTHENIVKEVAPTSVLSGEELSGLLCAVIGNQPWNPPGLSSSQTLRQPNLTTTSQTVAAVNVAIAPAVRDRPVQVFKTEKSYNVNETYVPRSPEGVSSFTIETKKPIELKKFVLKPKSISELNGAQFYTVSCYISIKKRVNESYSTFYVLSAKKNSVFGGDDKFTVDAINPNDNTNVKLEANSKYHFKVELSPAHVAYNLSYQTYQGGKIIQQDTTLKERPVYQEGTGSLAMTVQHHSAIHVREIHFKILD